MRFVRSSPNEFLVLGRKGKLRSLGTGSSALLLPGATWVTVPSSKQEADFAMTQESSDGIPLRFKGIVIYRVVDPVVAATSFDFSDGRGHAEIKDLVANVCLGELRHTVSHLTMQDCIEQRKTTLTDAVAGALSRVAGASPHESEADGGPGWGIAFEIIQVAQVFIVTARRHRSGRQQGAQDGRNPEPAAGRRNRSPDAGTGRRSPEPEVGGRSPEVGTGRRSPVTGRRNRTPEPVVGLRIVMQC